MSAAVATLPLPMPVGSTITVSSSPFSASHSAAARRYPSTVPKTEAASTSAMLLPEPMIEAASRSYWVQAWPETTGTVRTDEACRARSRCTSSASIAVVGPSDPTSSGARSSTTWASTTLASPAIGRAVVSPPATGSPDPAITALEPVAGRARAAGSTPTASSAGGCSTASSTGTGLSSAPAAQTVTSTTARASIPLMVFLTRCPRRMRAMLGVEAGRAGVPRRQPQPRRCSSASSIP